MEFTPELIFDSGHFSTRGSKVCCEFANYVSNFGSWAGTSQLISKFNFNFCILISHTKIIKARVLKWRAKN